MDLILKYSINITPTFSQELDKIYNYMVYNLKVPNIANKFNKKVKISIFSLTYFPERFSKILVSNKSNLRKLIIDNYIIIYEIDSNKRTSKYFTYFLWTTKLFKIYLVVYNINPINIFDFTILHRAQVFPNYPYKFLQTAI